MKTEPPLLELLPSRYRVRLQYYARHLRRAAAGRRRKPWLIGAVFGSGGVMAWCVFLAPPGMARVDEICLVAGAALIASGALLWNALRNINACHNEERQMWDGLKEFGLEMDLDGSRARCIADGVPSARLDPMDKDSYDDRSQW